MEIYSKLKQEVHENSLNFIDFLEHVENFLSSEEFGEIFIRNEDLIFQDLVKSFEDFVKVWEIIERKLNFGKIQEILDPFYLVNYELKNEYEIPVYANKQNMIFAKVFPLEDGPELLKAHFEKFEKYLSEEKIFEHLVGHAKLDVELGFIESRLEIDEEYEKYFHKSEFHENRPVTSLVLATRGKTETFKTYWDFLLKYVKSEDLKKFLLKSSSALESASLKNDPEFFKFFTDFYRKFFTNEELRKMFKLNLRQLFSVTDPENCQEVADFFEKIYENNSKDLLNILTNTLATQSHDLLFFRNKEAYRKKLKPFIKLLKKYGCKRGQIVEWDEGFESKFDEE